MSPIFQAGGALSADHATYVERQADQDALRAALNGEYLHVIAPRQVGKTSLLKRLADRLDKRGWHCIYVDLATLMDLPKPDWYAELGRTLAQGLTPGQIPALTHQIDLRSYLLDQALPWAGKQPHIALIMDEVEGAGKARDADGRPFSDTFFSMFRALFNERDKINGTLVVALAGAVNPGDLVSDPDISPFNVGQEISLDGFSAAETQALTNHLAELDLPIDDSVHRAIYEWTSGHPYLSQRICAELERSAQSGSIDEIAPGRVEQVIEEILLNPASPLQQDKNLRHAARVLNRLSTPAARLWSRLRTGESIACKEATDDLFLELYLTGVVQAHDGYLVIRNRIYERAFAERGQAKSSMVKTSKSEGVAMNRPIRVFLSSTWQDLQSEREAVEKALHRMQDTAFAGMEYFGSRPETPKEVSLAEVDRSEVYVGIFAHRYGSGITEAEYHRAHERKIPCLIYLKDDNVPVIPAYMERDPARALKLEALKDELKQHHVVSFFQSPDHLASQVIADLHNSLASMAPAREGDVSSFGPKYQITITDSQGIVIGDGAQVSQQLVVPVNESLSKSVAFQLGYHLGALDFFVSYQKRGIPLKPLLPNWTEEAQRRCTVLANSLGLIVPEAPEQYFDSLSEQLSAKPMVVKKCFHIGNVIGRCWFFGVNPMQAGVVPPDSFVLERLRQAESLLGEADLPANLLSQLRHNWEKAISDAMAGQFSSDDATDRQMIQAIEEAAKSIENYNQPPSSQGGDPFSYRTLLPTKLYSSLIGRDEKVRECLDSLQDPRAHPMIGIFGFGGIGKTALAREIAEQALTDRAFHAAFWMTAKRVSFEPDEATVGSATHVGYDQILSEIVLWLGMQSELGSMRKLAEKQRRIKEILDASPSLLVLDNLETASEDQEQIIIKLRKILGRSRAILTSREQTDPRIEIYRIQLAGLSEADSVKLMKEVALLRGVARVQFAPDDQLAELANTVGGAPLALKLIVGLMMTQDAAHLKDSLVSVKGKLITEMYRYLFLRSWRELDEPAKKIMLTLIHFGEGAAAKAVRLQAASRLSIPRFTCGIDQLTRLSLVEVGGEIDSTHYSLHPLTRNFIGSDLLGNTG